MEILWDNRSGMAIERADCDALEKVLHLGLAHTNAPEAAEVSLSLVDKGEIQTLNRIYRQIDRETDVLSFPFYEDETDFPVVSAKDWPVPLGDIVICPQVAESQAIAYNHSFLRELAFLAVHGLLHLMGYDHAIPEEEQAMMDAQNHILNKAGILR